MLNAIILSLLFCAGAVSSLYTVYLHLEFKNVCKDNDMFAFYEMKKLDYKKTMAITVASTAFTAFLVMILLTSQS